MPHRESTAGNAPRNAVTAGLLALLTTLAAALDLTALDADTFSSLVHALTEQTHNWQSAQAIHLMLFLSLFVLYAVLLRRSGPPLPSGAVLGALCSAFLLVGRSFAQTDTWTPLFGTPFRLLLTALSFLGLWVFFALTLSALLRWLDGRGAMRPPVLTRKQYWASYALFFALIFLGWLGYLIACYPGSVTGDGFNQLGQFEGAIPASNSHPWFSTLVMGAIVSLAPDLPSGIFLYCLFQSAVCALAYAAVCQQLWVQTGRKWIPALALVYYLLVPTWGCYAQMVVKDTLFCGVFTALGLCVMLFVQRRGQCGLPLWAALFALALATALLRGGIATACMPFLALLLLLPAKSRRSRVIVLGMAAALAVSCGIWSRAVLPAAGVAPGSTAESLSLPFQQTARVAVQYGDELTPEEIAVIDSVLDYDTIRTQYDPRVSDPVKATYHGTPEDLRTFLGLWTRLGLRYPGACLGAALNSVFGYFLPGYRYGTYGGGFFGFAEPAGADSGLAFAHPGAVDALDTFSRLWSATPVLAEINSPGLHVWILLFCLTALLRKRRFAPLLSALPGLLCLFVCVLSPVNGLVRYALPLMAMTPALLLSVCAALSPREDPGPRQNPEKPV